MQLILVSKKLPFHSNVIIDQSPVGTALLKLAVFHMVSFTER